MNKGTIHTVLEEIIKQASKEARLNNVIVHLKGKLTHVHKVEFTDINATYKQENDTLEFDVMVKPL